MTMLRRAGRAGRAVTLAALVALAGGAVAQTVGDDTVPQTNLDIPTNLQVFGKLDPNVRKATAIVNGTVITGTDVDQRVALIEAARGEKLPAGQADQIKMEVLRQLIDETLQIQEAKTEDISIAPAEISQSFDGVAGRFNQTPAKFASYLRDKGSSDRSLKRQIEGELAWQRYLRRRVEPFVNVGDAEVTTILERLKAAQGTDEYHLREIYMKADANTAQQTYATMRQVLGELGKQGQTFDAIALKYSDSTTKTTGGDLGWVRLNVLPEALSSAAQQMQVGQIAGPVEVPGGYSLLYLEDKRQVGTADPKDARLNLKQLTIRFPAGTTREGASARTAEFGKQLSALQGCGSVQKVAAGIGAEVVDNDSITVRQLPGQLQDIILRMQVGQATPPFGTPEEVRSLVLCGRDDPKQAQLPAPQQVQNQLEQQRVNLRAQQKLRDLRRDAIVEYR